MPEFRAEPVVLGLAQAVDKDGGLVGERGGQGDRAGYRQHGTHGVVAGSWVGGVEEGALESTVVQDALDVGETCGRTRVRPLVASLACGVLDCREVMEQRVALVGGNDDGNIEEAAAGVLVSLVDVAEELLGGHAPTVTGLWWEPQG